MKKETACALIEGATRTSIQLTIERCCAAICMYCDLGFKVKQMEKALIEQTNPHPKKDEQRKLWFHKTPSGDLMICEASKIREELYGK